MSTGPLAVSSNLTVHGLGANRLSISGKNASQLFTLSGSAQVTIADLTLTGGKSSQGGAILTRGTAALTLDSDILSGSGVTITVSQCTFENNSATGGSNAANGGGDTAAGGGAVRSGISRVPIWPSSIARLPATRPTAAVARSRKAGPSTISPQSR